jgi:hypothetical protein
MTARHPLAPLSSHDADLSDELADFRFASEYRAKPFMHRFPCGCELHVVRSSDEGGGWQDVWVHCGACGRE